MILPVPRGAGLRPTRLRTAARFGRLMGSASSLRRDERATTELFSRSADGTGRDEPLLTRAKDLVDLRASSWSPDGRRLLFIEVTEVRRAAECRLADRARAPLRRESAATKRLQQ